MTDTGRLLMQAPAGPACKRTPGSALQRKCDCGNHTVAGGECDECRKKRAGIVRRQVVQDAGSAVATAIVGEALASPGEPLGVDVRRRFEPLLAREVGSPGARLQRSPTGTPHLMIGPAYDEQEAEAERVATKLATAPSSSQHGGPRYDFSQVRIHTGAKAADSARGMGAVAYTVDHDIVFGPGAYAPSTTAGDHLLAHELTHVIQQGQGRTVSDRVVQRQKAPPSPKRAPQGAKPSQGGSKASSRPTMSLTPSTNGAPCACVVVVHNDERNARKIAELMHSHCAYNLVLIQPDTSVRTVDLPSRKDVDPNSLFPRDIAARCLDDPQGCRDTLTAKAGTTNAAEIEQLIQIQFFLTLSDCSSAFALPVVALHNNDIQDTKKYLADKATQGVSDLRVDIDKTDPAAGAAQVAKLKKLVKTKFGEGVVKEVMETAGKTNIFRWCASPDLAKCHVGDPDHPDTITWVTNETDFDALRVKEINVVLQVGANLPESSESKGDLSTLFLILKELINVRLVTLVAALDQQSQVDLRELEKIITELANMAEFDDLRIGNTAERILEILRLLLELLLIMLAKTHGSVAAEERIRRLRYVNIETPGKALTDQTEAERISSYEAIVSVLKTLGLHCCGDDPAKAEGSIKAGLKGSGKGK